MRRVVARGLGIAAVAWALGSSDWRGYWSEFWKTARAQLATSNIADDHDGGAADLAGAGRATGTHP